LQQIAAIYGLRTRIKAPIADTVQIQLADGATLDMNEFLAAIQNQTVYNFHPGVRPGIIYLYSVDGCPYAAKAREMLNAKGIPFVNVDLNNQSLPRI